MFENNQWVIHGLWPQYTLKNYPTFCKDVTFDINSLESIKDDLDKHWFSDTGDNQSFWEHEWKKHGSCMFDTDDITWNEFKYFNLTLKLYHEVIDSKIIEKYSKDHKAKIPIDLNLKIMNVT